MLQLLQFCLHFELNDASIIYVVFYKFIGEERSCSALLHLCCCGSTLVEDWNHGKPDAEPFKVFKLWRLWDYCVYFFGLFRVWFLHNQQKLNNQFYFRI